MNTIQKTKNTLFDELEKINFPSGTNAIAVTNLNLNKTDVGDERSIIISEVQEPIYNSPLIKRAIYSILSLLLGFCSVYLLAHKELLESMPFFVFILTFTAILAFVFSIGLNFISFLDDDFLFFSKKYRRKLIQTTKQSLYENRYQKEIIVNLHERIFFVINNLLKNHYKKDDFKENFISDYFLANEDKEFLLQNGFIKLAKYGHKGTRKIKDYEYRFLNNVNYVVSSEPNIILNDDGISKELFEKISEKECFLKTLANTEEKYIIIEFLSHLNVLWTIYDAAIEDYVVTFGPNYEKYIKRYNQII